MKCRDYPGSKTFNMPRFVQNVLLALLAVISCTQYSVETASISPESPGMLYSDHFSFGDTFALRTLGRSRRSEGSINNLFALSPGSTSDKSVTSSDSLSPSTKMFASQTLPEKLVDFLEKNPFPFAVDRYRPFNPLDIDTWIKYFVSSKITMKETFDMIEELASEAEKEIYFLWSFSTSGISKRKLVHVLFGSAFPVYFKKPYTYSILQTFRDMNFMQCHKMVFNKLVD